jgi:nucleotide-binding universal stress UspA family protein
MFKTLVVALDLADDGDRALPIVQALARRGSVAVDLVTVSEPGMSTEADAYELERRAVRYGWECDAWTIVHDVDAAAGLVEHAARREEPLLVMATSAKRPMSSSVFGSFTRDVLRRGQGPVLLIGPSVPDDSAPTLTSLVVGVDREAINSRTVPSIVSWQSTFAGDRPQLVEVVGPFDDDRPARSRLDDLAAELAAQHIRASSRVTVADDPIAGLDDAIVGLDGPVFVAVSARYTDGRLHWHSTTQRLVAHAGCPVLVVPARPMLLPDHPVIEDHRPFHDRTSTACDATPAMAGTTA